MKSMYEMKCYQKHLSKGRVHISSYDIVFPKGEPFYIYKNSLPIFVLKRKFRNIFRKLPVRGPKRWVKLIEPKLPCLFK